MTRLIEQAVLFTVFMLLLFSVALAVDVAAFQVRGKIIKVGDTADYAFSVLTKDEMVEQEVRPDPNIPGSLIVIKHYEADGQTFVMSFARRHDPGPYVVIGIDLEAPSAPSSADSLSIAKFDQSSFLENHKPRDTETWNLKSGGKNHYYSFSDPENPYSGMGVELSWDPQDIRRIGVSWHGESTLNPAKFTKRREGFLRDLLASTFASMNADSVVAYIKSQKGKNYPGGGNAMPRKVISGIAVHCGICGEALVIGFEK